MGAESTLFFLVSLWGAWFTFNGIRPRYSGGRVAVLSFFAGWLTVELALHHIAWQALFTLLFVWAGALDGWLGWVGLGITLVSWAGLVWCFQRAHTAEEVVETALRQGLGREYADGRGTADRTRVDWPQILLPFPLRHPEVERVKNLPYAVVDGRPILLDVYRPADHRRGCPVLVQIHGGAWILGSKNEQGLPLMYHLASRGWVCMSIDYRLSPRATFPAHIVDVKRALAWVKEHAAEYGGDPTFVVVTGGSAGGHLCALAALTANDPAYQPGFESVDTSVQGCVSFYGVYDFTDRFSVWPHRGLHALLEKRVLKVAFDEDRGAWDQASPLSRVHPEAPPFFVIHGDQDTLVPVEEARRFAAALRSTTPGPVVYAEIPGAQHAFEIFPSVRTTFVIHGVERFLAYLLARRQVSVPSEAQRSAV